MDPRFDIPHRRPLMPIWRICLVMGLTALLLLMLASRIEVVMDMLANHGYA